MANPPVVKVLLAAPSDISAPPNPASMTDITQYVSDLNIQQGRSQEMEQIEAGTCDFTLTNETGLFTPGRTGRQAGFNLGAWIVVQAVQDGGAGSTTSLFTGNIESLSLSTAGTPETKVTAVDGFKMLGQRTLNGVAARALAMELNPWVYLPMDEGGTQAAVTGPFPNEGSIGGLANVVKSHPDVTTTVQSGADAPFIAARSGGSFVFNPEAPAGAMNTSQQVKGSWVECDVPPWPVETFTVEFWFKMNVAQNPVPGTLWIEAPLVQILYPEQASYDANPLYPVKGGGLGIGIMTQSDGTASVEIGDGPTSALTGGNQKFNSNAVRDGNWHHFCLVARGERVGEAFKVYSYLDGVENATTNSFWNTSITPTVPVRAQKMRIGGARADGQNMYEPWFGNIAHFVMGPVALTAAQVADRYNTVRNGRAADTEGTRINWLADRAGIPTANRNIDTSGGHTLTALEYGSEGEAWNPLDAMQDHATIDGQGALWMDGAGRLTYLSAAGAASKKSSLTFALDSATSPDVGLSFEASDTRLVNRVTVNGPGGSSFTFQNDASAAAFGPRSSSYSTDISDPLVRQDLAQWIVATTTSTDVRMESVTFTPTTSAGLWPLIFAANIGEILTITGFPSWAPASSLELRIEGVQHSIMRDGGALQWVTTLSTSPRRQAWVLEDNSYGLLDSTAILVY